MGFGYLNYYLAFRQFASTDPLDVVICAADIRALGNLTFLTPAFWYKAIPALNQVSM